MNNDARVGGALGACRERDSGAGDGESYQPAASGMRTAVVCSSVDPRGTSIAAAEPSDQLDGEAASWTQR